MGIEFAFRQNVQLVRLTGPLTPEEDAAVRLKLDQKISAGRSLVLFHLAEYPVTETTPRSRLMGIISFCLERGVTVGISGAEPSRWPLLRFDGRRQARLYQSETEALSALASPDTQETALTQNGKEAPDQGESEFRRRQIDELLRTYESYQQGNNLDPFGLEMLAATYARDRNREALNELDKALRQLPAKRALVQKLTTEAERLAEELFEFTFHRKLPVTAKEAEAKARDIEIERDSLSGEKEELTKEIASLEQKLANIDRAAQDARAKLDTKIQAAELELKNAADETARLRDSLSVQTENEQRLLLEIKAKLGHT